MEENKNTTENILIELHKRRQGYLFGGSDKSWCASPAAGKERKPIGKGCSKYASCKLIPEEIKWKTADELTKEDIEILQKQNCYRASYHVGNNNDTKPDVLWDPAYIPERAEETWIGNPMGIRKFEAAVISAKLINNPQLKHRDTRPCPNGGCVVPEMEAAYFSLNEAESWNEIKACPFYFRATNENFRDFDKNLSRYAQCYITSEQIISFLKANRYISSASLFRDSEKPDLFWYPFYSGYSFVQPLCLPNETSDPGWQIISPSLRWHATSVKRLSRSNKKPNVNIFRLCEDIGPANPEKFPRRILDVCDGYASFALLTWVLANRLNVTEEKLINEGKVEWEYENGYELYIKLQEIGFTHQLNNRLKLRPDTKQEKVFRKSKLEEDLELLGLIINGKETVKYEYLLKWIKQGDHEVDLTDGFLNFSPGITSIKTEVEKYDSLPVLQFVRHLLKLVQAKLLIEKSQIQDKSAQQELWEYDKLSALSPPLHIIVRAYLIQPLRWLFIPANVELAENNKAKVTSGTILLLTDSDNSQAYNRDIRDNENEILQAVVNIYPLLSSINAIEEQNRRDMMEQERLHAVKEKEKFAVQAAISQVMARNMSHNIGSHVMNKLTDPGYLKKFSNQKSKKPYQQTFPLEKAEGSAFGQIANYNNYVRCRMDYLSDISFSTPLMQTSRKLYSDVFRELDKVHLLLNNISGLGENFQYKIQLEVKNRTGGFELLSDQTDFELAFSNDVLGMQAFYNIIEAVIRNTAKHAENKEKPTVITIRFSEIAENELTGAGEELKGDAKRLVCAEIFDNADLSVEVTNKNKRNASKLQKKKLVKKGEDSILDKHFESFYLEDPEAAEYGVPYADWLVFRQNRRLNEPILNENNQLRATALGLIEMDASAAYLRRLDTSMIDNPEYEISYDNSFYSDKLKFHTLKAVKIETSGKSYLGYRFFIPKPEEVLIVTRDRVAETENISQLKNKGIWVISEDEYVQHIHEKGGVYNHNFIVHTRLDKKEVLYKGSPINILECYASSITQRIIKISDTFLTELTQFSKEKILGICWRYWSKQFLPADKTRSITGYINTKANDSIVYLNHLYSENNEKPGVYWNKHKEAFHLEALSSSAQRRLPDFNLSKQGDNPSSILKNYLGKVVHSDEGIQLKIYEGAFTNVVVIDERIQSCLEQDFMGIKYKELFPKMHVFIPGKTINLSSESGGEQLGKDIEDFIGTCITEPFKSKSFLVIHYSILERIFGREVRKYQAIETFLQRYATRCNLVVTSGRGTPEDLPDGVRYVSLSSLFNAVIQVRSKYVINDLLHAARKPYRR